MAVVYPTDATTRTATTLESSDMTFLGRDASNNPLETNYSEIKTAVAHDDDDFHTLTAESASASDDEILIYDTSAGAYRRQTKANFTSSLSGSGADYILIRDVKTSGTGGGTFTSGADQTRDLTEKTVDVGSHATLSSNQVTLASGTYEFKFSAPAYHVDNHQAWLYNVSDSAIPTGGEGTSENAAATYSAANRSFGSGRFTIATSKTFEVRHRCLTTGTTYGFGVAVSMGTPNAEIYTILEFWKVA